MAQQSILPSNGLFENSLSSELSGTTVKKRQKHEGGELHTCLCFSKARSAAQRKREEKRKNG